VDVNFISTIIKFGMNYKDFKKYSLYLRYWLFFITLFIAVFSIKEYLKHSEIEKAMTERKIEWAQLLEEKLFMEKFQYNYFKSNYVNMFIRHENNILSEWEYKIKIIEKDTRKDKTIEKLSQLEMIEKTVSLNTPQKSRLFFLQDKYKNFQKNIFNN
jgi:hypothetical protein